MVENEAWFSLRVDDHKMTFKNKLNNIKAVGSCDYPVKEDLKTKLRKMIGMKTEVLERILRHAKGIKNLNKEAFNDPYLINFYYWCTELKINFLSEIFEIDITKDKNDIIKDNVLRIDFVCESCGDVTCFYPNSRSKRNDNLLGVKNKYYKYLFCETCKERHKKRKMKHKKEYYQKRKYKRKS